MSNHADVAIQKPPTTQHPTTASHQSKPIGNTQFSIGNRAIHRDFAMDHVAERLKPIQSCNGEKAWLQND